MSIMTDREVKAVFTSYDYNNTCDIGQMYIGVRPTEPPWSQIIYNIRGIDRGE